MIYFLFGPQALAVVKRHRSDQEYVEKVIGVTHKTQTTPQEEHTPSAHENSQTGQDTDCGEKKPDQADREDVSERGTEAEMEEISEEGRKEAEMEETTEEDETPRRRKRRQAKHECMKKISIINDHFNK